MYHAVNTENFTPHTLHVLSQDNYFPNIFCVVFQIIFLTFSFLLNSGGKKKCQTLISQLEQPRPHIIEVSY